MSLLWSNYGQSAGAELKAALQIEQFESIPGQAGMELSIVDTAGDPEQALAELKAMHDRGIRIVIGPMTSEEAFYVLDFVDEHDMLLISPSASASKLAKDDNLIRLVPTDQHQADALTRTMSAHGISTLALVHIDDMYGYGFRDEITAAAESVGMTVLPAIAVNSEKPNFPQVVKELETMITADDSMAVLLVETDRRAILLAHAIGLDSPLRKVKWYVGESIASSEFALTDELFAAFAAGVAMEGFNLSVDMDIFDSGIPLIQHMILTNSPELVSLSPFAFTSWDALRLIALTYRKAGMVDTATFKSELMNRSHYYANVFNLSSAVDEYGDMMSCRYTRYRFTQESDQPARWQLSGVYVFSVGLPPFVIDYDRIYTTDVGEITIGALLPLTSQVLKIRFRTTSYP